MHVSDNAGALGGPARPPGGVLAELRSVSKVYGPVLALEHVDLTLRAGEVHALVGENGAGKSTLVKILAGIVRPDAGEVELAQAPAVVHQELSIVPALSVLDNLLLGDARVGFVYRRRRFRAEARRHLDEIGLAHVGLDQKADALSLAEQQLVEISRGIARDARVTVLDEPTATLSDAEIERVFAALGTLRARGHALLYISHRLREIFALADRVTTLRNGRVVAEQPIGELTTERLVNQMIGATISERQHEQERREAQLGAPILSVSDGASSRHFAGLELSVRAGEIVGLLGQVGSGADAVVRSLAGLDPDFTGSVTIGDVRIDRFTLAAAQRAGVSYLSESRQRDGLFLDFSVETNLASSVLPDVSPRGVVRPRLLRDRASQLAHSFTVPPDRLAGRVSQLSGGNQQKVALAKAVAARPRVLLLSEPTRGVDVGARTEIYQHLRRLADDGMAIVCFTSDVTEVNDLCDRVLTMFRGGIVRSVDVAAGLEATLLADILHGAQEAAA